MNYTGHAIELAIQLLLNFGRLRKLAFITLLFIYAGSQFGPVLVSLCKPFVHTISALRQQRRMRQERAAVRDTTMSMKQYLACLHEKNELLINGVLHDIKDVRFNGDFVHLKLLEDKKETNWMKGLASLTNAIQKQKRSQRSLQQLWSWLFTVYPFEKEIDFKFEPVNLQKLSFLSKTYPIYSLALNSPGQPPDHLG